jgi:hypothetical protein
MLRKVGFLAAGMCVLLLASRDALPAGGGPELVVNGTFDNGLNGWTVTGEGVETKLIAEDGLPSPCVETVSVGYCTQNIPTVPDTRYVLNVDCKAVGGGDMVGISLVQIESGRGVWYVSTDPPSVRGDWARRWFWANPEWNHISIVFEVSDAVLQVGVFGMLDSTWIADARWDNISVKQDFPEGSISGKVTLDGHPPTGNNGLVTFEIREPGTTVIAANTPEDENRYVNGTQVVTAGDGSYALSRVPVGTYDLAAKSNGYLRGKISNVVVTAGQDTGEQNFSLSGADFDDSNSVSITDLNILKKNYGKKGAE